MGLTGEARRQCRDARLVNLSLQLVPALHAGISASGAALLTRPSAAQLPCNLLVLQNCQNRLPGGLVRQQPLPR